MGVGNSRESKSKEYKFEIAIVWGVGGWVGGRDNQVHGGIVQLYYVIMELKHAQFYVFEMRMATGK